MQVGSYPKIYNLGHKNLDLLFDGTVVVQEKIDGSQISFGLNDDGFLFVHSKRTELCGPEHNSMFTKGYQEILELQDLLLYDVVYRGEYLEKPRHNVLAYQRIPKHHIILFDIETINCAFNQLALREEAARLDLEVVPTIYVGDGESFRISDTMLERQSILGGPIEGIVIKNYGQLDAYGNVLMGKYVRSEFKEVHTGKIKSERPDIVQQIVDSFTTEARWIKAVSHLKEEGVLVNAPEDIGPLIKEIQTDILAEEKEAITKTLFDYYWKEINRQLAAGFPEWYKDKLSAGFLNSSCLS